MFKLSLSLLVGFIGLACSTADRSPDMRDAENTTVTDATRVLDTEMVSDTNLANANPMNRDVGSPSMDGSSLPDGAIRTDMNVSQGDMMRGIPDMMGATDMMAMPDDMGRMALDMSPEDIGMIPSDMSPDESDASSPPPEPAREDERLENWRAMYNFPGLTAMVFADGDIIARGVAGVRVHGGEIVVEDSDRFHIGSCTKAMTSTLLGRFVDAGSMSFDDTLEEIFADLLPIHDDFRRVTLGQLIRHLGGTPASLINGYPELWRFMRDNEAGDQRAVRRELTRTILSAAPTNPIGEYTYSNAGYIIVGAAMEEVLGRSWEDLMQREIFDPLGMQDCGFGGAATAGAIDHPWAHRRGPQNENVPVDPAGVDDNPTSLGPAGTVHCSMDAWKRFLDVHVGAGPEGYLSADTLAALHTPYEGTTYAGGWGIAMRNWGGGMVLTHSGSNTMNYTTTWIAPEKNAGLMVATNVSYDAIRGDLDSIIWALIMSHIQDL